MLQFKEKFLRKRRAAKRYNIEFTLTFEQYLKLVKDAEITSPDQIGNKGDPERTFQLGRYKDQGGYTIDNCRFITQLENIKERNEHFDISKSNKERVEKGTYNLLKVPPWNHNAVTPELLEVWIKADLCYTWWKETNLGYRRLLKSFNLKSRGACLGLVNKFKSGWIPNEDESWLNFKDIKGKNL